MLDSKSEAPAKGLDQTVTHVANVVPAKRTPLSGTEAAKELRKAWFRLAGSAPNQELLEVLTAQWAHETGNGGAMFNYNFGGIRSTSERGASFIWTTREGQGDKLRVGPGRFRAYPDAEAGATDYLFLLIRQYPRTIEPAKRGDVAAFVQALKNGGYFTGNERVYTRALFDLRARVRRWGFDSLRKLS